MQSIHHQANYLHGIAAAIDKTLYGYCITDVFKQDKHSLVFVFNKSSDFFSIRVSIQASQLFFQFYNHQTDRTGSVYPLFKEIVQVPFTVARHKNNRSFQFNFSNGAVLLFKLYGSLTNIILYKNNIIHSMFRPEIESDYKLSLTSFTKDNGPLTNTIDAFYVYKQHHNILLLAEPITDAEILFETDNVFKAANFFCKNYISYNKFYSTKKNLLLKNKQHLIKIQATLTLAEKAIQQVKNTKALEETGHLLMANLHLLNKGQTVAELYNFYSNTTEKIKLKKDLTPYQNAEYYYHKAKSSDKQVNALNAKILNLKNEYKIAQQTTDKIEKAQSLTELNLFIALGNNHPAKKISQFKEYTFKNYIILVGKNAKNNDELTAKYAHKNDMWLHAKDVTGSHVIIKHQGNLPFSKEVIIFAAKLAAYYSKAKHSALVPVTYTQKKFVRKFKGALAGEVKVDKEDVILVEPGINEIQ